MKKALVLVILSLFISFNHAHATEEWKIDSNQVKNLTILVSKEHSLIPLSHIKSNFRNIEIIDKLIKDNYDGLKKGEEIREDSIIIRSHAQRPWAKELVQKTYLLKKEGEEIYCLLQQRPPLTLINTEFFVLLFSLIFIIFLSYKNQRDPKKNWLTIALVSMLAASFIANLYIGIIDALGRSLLETTCAFVLIKMFEKLKFPLKLNLILIYSLAAWHLNDGKMFFVIIFVLGWITVLILSKIYTRHSKLASLP